MIETKTVVIQDGKVINIGDWDYGYTQVVLNEEEIREAHQLINFLESERDRKLMDFEKEKQKEGYEGPDELVLPEVDVEIPESIIENQVTNPLPEGATFEQMEVEYTVDGGYRVIDAPTPKTNQERIVELEDTIITLLEEL
ncbi:hypothetical protein ACIQZG_04540 [Lysinibacillus sp. NPDC096418]|uniref:hypothetical protein n=1 Tax=Lysinibacillus sp. NPDC096418 TaxID=3364138 RepID=UPI003802B8FA